MDCLAHPTSETPGLHILDLAFGFSGEGGECIFILHVWPLIEMLF